MKRLLPLLLLSTLFLVGCVKDDPFSRTTIDDATMTVKVITVDGHDYVVAYRSSGIAICPKTP